MRDICAGLGNKNETVIISVPGLVSERMSLPSDPKKDKLWKFSIHFARIKNVNCYISIVKR